MQLLIILALLLYGGKGNAQNLISEVKPVLEQLGGEDMAKALKSAEEITEVLNAVQGVSSAMGGGFANTRQNAEADFSSAYDANAVNFPLKPISGIADRDITYSLSKYISQN